MDDLLKKLENWKIKSKGHAVSISIDDGYGANCWVVTLWINYLFKVVVSEVSFLGEAHVWPKFEESKANHGRVIYTVVVDGDSEDDWPGLERTLGLALDVAQHFESEV